MEIDKHNKLMAVGCVDGSIKLWDLTTGQCRYTFKEHNVYVAHITFNEQGTKMVSVDTDYNVKCIDIECHRCYFSLKSQYYLSSTRFALNDTRILTIAGANVRLIDISCYEVNRYIDGGLHGVIISPDRSKILLQIDYNTFKLWDVNKRRFIRTFSCDTDIGITSMAFSPDNEHFVVSGERTYLWNIHSQKPLSEWFTIPQFHSYVSFNLDGDEVMCETSQRELFVWSVHSRELKVRKTCDYNGHLRDLPSIIVNDKYCYFAQRFSIVVADMDDNSLLRIINGHTGLVHVVSHSIDGKYLISSDGHEVKVWDFDSGVCLQTIKQVRSVSGCYFTADNKYIILVYGNGDIEYIEFESLQELISETRERFKDSFIMQQLRKRYDFE